MYYFCVGDLFLFKEPIYFNSNANIVAGSVGLIVKARSGYIIDVLIGEQKYTWDTWDLQDALKGGEIVRLCSKSAT